MTHIIEVNHICKTFHSSRFLLKKHHNETQALNDISFNIHHNESLGLVGESGSGKSTLANIIMLLEHPDCGEILFNQKSIHTLSNQERKDYYRSVQMVFQDPLKSLNPKKTIGWSISEALVNLGNLSPAEIKKKVYQSLRDVGLDESFYDYYPNQISGGQRQRATIAAAIVVEPQLLIIDEGVSALDVSIQAAILNLLNDLKTQYNLTYLFISHDLNVIEYFCDRVVVFQQGKLIEIFDPEKTSIQLRSDYTQKLYDAIPKIYHEKESI